MNLKLKTLFACAGILATGLTASAETYFLATESKGDGDGTSWENAMGADDLKTVVESLAESDICCFMEGTYKAVAMTIPQGVTVKGGFPATSTGTKTDNATPFATPTIWNADLDGDGEGDNGTTSLITINAETLSADSKTTTVCGITFTNAKYTGTSRDGSLLHGHACKIVFENCTFQNCKNSCEGGVLYVNKADLNCRNCVWKDNYSEKNPVCLKSNTVQEGIVVLNGCSFTGNTCKTDYATSSNGKHGGMIGFKGKALYIVNCTADGNGFQLNNNGAFVRNDAGLPLFMAYNTVFNYYASGTNNKYGQIASIAKNTPLFMVGNIMVNKDNNTENASKFGCVYLQAGTGTDNVVDGGWNYFGGLFQSGQEYKLATTDVLDATDTSVFGSNTPSVLTKNGMLVVNPKTDLRTVTTADVKTATAAWKVDGLPTLESLGIDLSKDILGNVRPATTVPGSYDENAGNVSSIAPVITINNDEPAVWYNLQGMKIQNPAKGNIYIRVQNGKSTKVAF